MSRRAERRSLRLRGFIFFKWKDSEAPPGMGGDPWPLHTGLLDADGFPKPGFWTFTALVHELANPAPATPGSAELAQVSRRNVRLSPRGFAGVIVGCGSERPGACAGTLRLRTAYPVACGGAFRRAGSQLGAAAFRVVVARLLEGGDQLAEDLVRERIARLGLVQRDRGDAVGDVV